MSKLWHNRPTGYACQVKLLLRCHNNCNYNFFTFSLIRSNDFGRCETTLQKPSSFPVLPRPSLLPTNSRLPTQLCTPNTLYSFHSPDSLFSNSPIILLPGLSTLSSSPVLYRRSVFPALPGLCLFPALPKLLLYSILQYSVINMSYIKN